MTDSWERRALPYVPGWNNAPDNGPQFTVVFDENADTLTITADQPVFGSIDEFTGEGEYPDGTPGWTFTVPNGSFTIDSPTQITLPGAWNYLVASPGVTAEITQLDFYNVGPTLIGIWTGSTLITEPLTYPILSNICSPAADTIRFEGSNFLLATAGPVGYVIPRMVDYGAGIILNGANMIVELASLPANWSLVTHTDTVIELSNPDFTNIEPSGGPGDFVVNGVAFHDPTATTFYYYEPWGDPSPYSAAVDGSGC